MMRQKHELAFLLAIACIGIGVLLGDLTAAGRLATVFAQDKKSPSKGTQLPLPDSLFQGKIAESFKDSKADYPLPIKALKGAPNVLLILLDDVGFGMCSTFGGPVPTPHMDKLAKNGLKYNRFYTTALCSPTRGALLASRNHHSIGSLKGQG